MGGIVYFIFKIFLLCEGEEKAFYGDIKRGITSEPLDPLVSD
jgi:hypothetical protein